MGSLTTLAAVGLTSACMLTGCAQYGPTYFFFPEFIKTNDSVTERAEAAAGASIADQEIPFLVDGDLMLIPVSIDGKAGFNFVLDTGATPTSLFNSAPINALNLAAGGSFQVSGGGDEAAPEAEIALPIDVTIGSITFEGLTPLIIPGEPLFGGDDAIIGYDGIIGFDLFSRFTVEVDWDARTFRLHKSGAFNPPAHAARLSIEEKGRDIYTTIDVRQGFGGPAGLVEDFDVHVDTGFGGAVWLPVGENSDFELSEDAVVLETRGVQGRKSDENALRVGYAELVRVAGKELEVVPTFFQPGEGDSVLRGGGRIGNSLLSQFNHAIDYADGAIHIWERFDKEPLERWSYGLGGVVTPAGVKMRAPLNGSPGDVAGFAENDLVVSVNGNPISAMSFLEARDALRGVPGGIADVCFLRGTEAERCLTLEAEDLRPEPYGVSMAPIAAAIADPSRPETDTMRDANRAPRHVLAFFEIKPGQRVLDVNAGGGYYTRLLSGVVGDDGEVVAHVDDFFVHLFGDPSGLAEERANISASVGVSIPNLGLSAEKFDRILAANTLHDLSLTHPQARPEPVDPAAAFKGLYDALKPGGKLGIIDHIGPDGMGFEISGQSHRIDPHVLITAANDAGFIFEGHSFELRNEDDPLSAPPFDPSIAGKTSRAVMKFRKPNTPQ